MLAGRGRAALVLQGGIIIIITTTDRRAVANRLADAKSGDGVLVIRTRPFIGEGFDAPAHDTLYGNTPHSTTVWIAQDSPDRGGTACRW